MSVFDEYSRYYDLLYHDKDYAGEVAYIDELIQNHCNGACTILNLGCGSGRHDRYFANKGYRVTGVDLSGEMLAAARENAGREVSLDYVQGDVRSVRLSNTFDVVVSLFHVMSYQVKNIDLTAAFATAHSHLNTGGIFIFDCWYGPGVLTDRPAVRVREIENETLRITRIAQPVMHANENVVDVNYHMFIRAKKNGQVREIKETHRMRYLFVPEVRQMLSAAGFEFLEPTTWMSNSPLGFKSWNSVFIGRKPR